MKINRLPRAAAKRAGAISLSAILLAGAAGPEPARAVLAARATGSFSASWTPAIPTASAGFIHRMSIIAPAGQVIPGLANGLNSQERQTLESFLQNPESLGLLEEHLKTNALNAAVVAARDDLEGQIAVRGRDITQAVVDGRADASSLSTASQNLAQTANRFNLTNSPRTNNVIQSVQLLDHHARSVDHHARSVEGMAHAQQLAQRILSDHGEANFGTIDPSSLDQAMTGVLGREGELAAKTHLSPSDTSGSPRDRRPEPPAPSRSSSASRRPAYPGDEAYEDILNAVGWNFTWAAQGQGPSYAIQGFAKKGQPLVFGVAAVRLTQHEGRTDLNLTIVHDNQDEAADFQRIIPGRVWSTRWKTFFKTGAWFSPHVHNGTHRLAGGSTLPATEIRLHGQFGKTNAVFFQALMDSVEAPKPSGMFNEPLFLALLRNPEMRPFAEILKFFPQEFRWETEPKGAKTTIYGFAATQPLAMGVHSIEIIRENGQTDLVLHLIHDDQRQSDEFRARVGAALHATQSETGTPDFSVMGTRSRRELTVEEHGRPVTRSFPETMLRLNGRFGGKNNVFFRHLTESDRPRELAAPAAPAASAAPTPRQDGHGEEKPGLKTAVDTADPSGPRNDAVNRPDEPDLTDQSEHTPGEIKLLSRLRNSATIIRQRSVKGGTKDAATAPATPKDSTAESPMLEHAFSHTLYVALLQNPAMQKFARLLSRVDSSYEWSLESRELSGKEPEALLVGRAKSHPLSLGAGNIVDRIRVEQKNGQAYLILDVTDPYRRSDEFWSPFVARVKSAEKMIGARSSAKFSLNIGFLAGGYLIGNMTSLRLSGEYGELNNMFVDNLSP